LICLSSQSHKKTQYLLAVPILRRSVGPQLVMPLQTSCSLPVIEGSEQPLTSDFLGPNPTVMSSAATNNYAIDARGNSRVFAGTVNTTFAGPIASVHVHCATSVDAHKKIIDWLDPKQLKAKHSRFHESVRKSFMEGTGLWFLDSKAFKTWKDEGGSPIWVHGLGQYRTIPIFALVSNACRKLDAERLFFVLQLLRISGSPVRLYQRNSAISTAPSSTVIGKTWMQYSGCSL
jgi:hypothetical protein